MSELLFSGRARPHYFLPGTVYDAALKRIEWLFDEFDGQVAVSCSGGKDSTVVVELAAKVARERNEPPLKVHFLDQEAEYQATIDYMRRLNQRDDIRLEWFQIPFRLFNAANHADEWSYVWDEDLTEDQWMRPKEPDSIKVNDFYDGKGRVIDRFKPLLSAMNKRTGGAILTGMRCEESPTRRVFMTSTPSYKWVTWCGAGERVKGTGKGTDRPAEHHYYLFNPIYDWSYRDVWKAIESGGWDYNVFYDHMFRYGVPTRSMRVSAFHHEESMGSLNYLQEVEPETWEKATQRYGGFNAFSQVGEEQFQGRRKLPYMFSDWDEYFEHLVVKLIPDEDNRRRFRQQRDRARREVGDFVPDDEIMISVVGSVLGNDVYGATTDKWISAQKNPDVRAAWLAKKKEEGYAFTSAH